MYCGCAAQKKGIKNPPGVPGRCSKKSVLRATVPKLFQNGFWPIFFSYQKVRKIPVFVVNTGYFHVSSQHFRCTFSGLFYSSKNRKKQENRSQVSTCHRFTSRSHASGFPLFPKNNRIFSFCSSSEIGVVIRSNILFILS